MSNYTDEVINYSSEQQSANNLQSDLLKSFSSVYDKFSPSIFGILMHWIKDEKLAGELLVTVFKNAWDSRKLYDEKKQRLFTWLYKITLLAYKNRKIVV